MSRLLKLQVKQSQLCGFVDIIIASSNTYVLIEVKESVMMRFKMKHVYISSSAFNKHRWPTKSVGYFAQKSRLLFALN